LLLCEGGHVTTLFLFQSAGVIMDFWVAASLFFGGALSHLILQRFLTAYSLLKVTTQLSNDLVDLTKAVASSLSRIQKMKYETLEAAGISEEEIEEVRSQEAVLFETWKMNFALSIYNNYPKQFRKYLISFDWDGALDDLNDIYK
jgi:ABC-type transport system involved in cytochrome bd biosynthesis fused ATPase/permease subunit